MCGVYISQTIKHIFIKQQRNIYYIDEFSFDIGNDKQNTFSENTRAKNLFQNNKSFSYNK